MKETFYFQHDYSARNDEKILELRAEFGWGGYGIYWAIIETIGENSKGGINRVAMGGLSIGLNYPKDKLIIFIDYCIEIGLFLEDEGFIHSKRFDDHLEFRSKLSEAGKLGAKRKWDKHKNAGKQAVSKLEDGEANGGAITTPMQRKGKERKGEESKVKYIYTNFYDSEIENSTGEEAGEYKKFVQFLYGENSIKEKLSKVLKMKNQISYDNYCNLALKYKAQIVIDTILSIENHKNDYKSFAITLSNWLKRNKTDNNQMKYTPPTKLING